MFNSQNLQEKWSPVLEHADLPKIDSPYKRAVTAVILENQEKAAKEDKAFLGEIANVTGDSAVANWDPILISLVRRAMPNLIAYDICGVQPMTGPTGLIFAMKSRFTSNSGTEALFNEPDSDFSGTGTMSASLNPGLMNDTTTSVTTGTGIATATAEASSSLAEMAFSIEKSTVTAKTRQLKAEYTMELAQDLKAIHGLDAETELANILSAEILGEINREVVRTIYEKAKKGANTNTTSSGTFDLDTDSNGRWSVEKFKGLMFQVERDANVIAQETRRGKGNILICSSDVASALQMAGILDYAPALNNSLNVDDTGNTFAGTLNGRYKVYIDPYASNNTAAQYFTVGYKGNSPYDAGMFYCPYVPLQMVRAVGQDSFQPKIGFKTRYGMVQNPFATSDGDGALDNSGAVAAGKQNLYYRRVQVTNLM
jgi:hypothetical protein